MKNENEDEREKGNPNRGRLVRGSACVCCVSECEGIGHARNSFLAYGKVPFRGLFFLREPFRGLN